VINICADKIYLSWIRLISITKLAKINKNNMINEHKYSKILCNHLCIIFDAILLYNHIKRWIILFSIIEKLFTAKFRMLNKLQHLNDLGAMLDWTIEEVSRSSWPRPYSSILELLYSVVVFWKNFEKMIRIRKVYKI
jgi:hypothetical protein